MNWNCIDCIVIVMTTADNKMAMDHAKQKHIYTTSLYLGINWSFGSTFVSKSLSELANFGHQISLPLVKSVTVPLQ